MEMGPKLRFVDVFPVKTDNGEMIALRDPSGLAEDILLVAREASCILYLLDGRHALASILHECRTTYGLPISRAALEEFVAHLDENYFLDNARSLQHRHEIEQQLLTAGVRPAAHAGTSYPKQKSELQRKLNEYFASPAGAGTPGPVNGLLAPAGVVAPHIDLRIGGATYTHAYRRIAEAQAADVYVIIGTAHAGLPDLYSVLPADFETPLGTAQVDRQFIAQLARNYPRDLSSGAFLHKSEHTVEFQVVFLQQALGDRPLKIVPILSGFSYHIFTYPQFERERKIVAEFTRALRQTVADYPGRVTVIASVDLAHVGPRYGDDFKIDESFLGEVEAADRRALENIARVDALGWQRTISALCDRYRVCGFAPIYTLLSCVQAQKGQVLHYEKGLMDDSLSVVTYCSAVLD